jgi:hypothetical protein
MKALLGRVAAQILLLLFGFALSRTVLWLLHASFFQMPDVSSGLKIYLHAFRFDFSAICAVNALYLLLVLLPKRPSVVSDKVLLFLFLCTNSIIWIFELADWVYFPYNHKRSTADVLWMLGRKGDFLNLLPGFFIRYWPLFLMAVLWIFTFQFLNRKICRKFPIPKNGPGWGWQSIGVYLLLLLLLPVGFRGGLQLMPIGIRNAVGIVENRYVPLILNTPFSIVSTINSRQLKPVVAMSPAEAEQLIPTVKQFPVKPFNRKNVVVIVLESFSKEFTASSGLKSYTPFLDSLMQQGYVCDNAFANGYHSAEGIPAIFAGIPSLGDEPFTTSPYGTNEITSLPRLLREKNYVSSFYHGGTNGTMAFDVFARNAGFDRYVGRTEYNNEKDFDSDWGIWDEPFLQFAAKDISRSMRQPFFAGIFTLSSHHPYKIPAQYKGRFPVGKLEIYESIGYADYSLRRFFETASKEPWFANTIFVLVADHCSALSDNLYYNVHQGRFAIPLLFYAPGDSSFRGRANRLCQQLDILPSVMHYLGYSDSFFAFGNSVFDKKSTPWAVQKIDGHLCWMMENLVLQSVDGAPVALYDIQQDSLETHTLLHEPGNRSAELLRYQQAFMQQYTNKMIQNRLYIRN